MKRYIIETDDEHIWSYEVEGLDVNFSCNLLKPHGDKAYWLEESQDYWEWFFGEICYVKEEEMDICLLYLETAKNEFKKFYEMMPKFNYSTDADWKVSELIHYFQDYRSTKLDVTMAENPKRFIQKNGKAIVVTGVGNFCLTNDTSSICKVSANLIEDEVTSIKADTILTKKKSRIKVFSPKVQKDYISDTMENIPTVLAIKKDQPTITTNGDDIPLKKITAEDLQRHIERQTEGQCDTVLFRSSVNSTNE